MEQFNTSLWFVRRRGIAVAVCASGNYLGGAVWPTIVQHFVETAGWRHTYIGLGIFCFVTMTALALLMRRRPPLASFVVTFSRITPTRGHWWPYRWRRDVIRAICALA